ncbi:hypothetical protein GWI33_000492, partial [Rhynchophorus ferrugineus]
MEGSTSKSKDLMEQFEVKLSNGTKGVFDYIHSSYIHYKERLYIMGGGNVEHGRIDETDYILRRMEIWNMEGSTSKSKYLMEQFE